MAIFFVLTTIPGHLRVGSRANRACQTLNILRISFAAEILPAPFRTGAGNIARDQNTCIHFRIWDFRLIQKCQLVHYTCFKKHVCLFKIDPKKTSL